MYLKLRLQSIFFLGSFFLAYVHVLYPGPRHRIITGLRRVARGDRVSNSSPPRSHRNDSCIIHVDPAIDCRDRMVAVAKESHPIFPQLLPCPQPLQMITLAIRRRFTRPLKFKWRECHVCLVALQKKAHRVYFAFLPGQLFPHLCTCIQLRPAFDLLLVRVHSTDDHVIV